MLPVQSTRVRVCQCGHSYLKAEFYMQERIIHTKHSPQCAPNNLPCVDNPCMYDEKCKSRLNVIRLFPNRLITSCEPILIKLHRGLLLSKLEWIVLQFAPQSHFSICYAQDTHMQDIHALSVCVCVCLCALLRRIKCVAQSRLLHVSDSEQHSEIHLSIIG